MRHVALNHLITLFFFFLKKRDSKREMSKNQVHLNEIVFTVTEGKLFSTQILKIVIEALILQ